MNKKRKPYGYWNNIKNCLNAAVNYNTRKEFQKNCGSAYNSAIKNGWIEKCYKHMIELKHPKGYWTIEKCIKEAKKYNNKSEFKKGSGSAYVCANKNNWLDKCCMHMELIGNNFKRLIYVIIFPKKYVYIGLTGNPKKRFYDHLKDIEGIPYKYIKKTGLKNKDIKFVKLTNFIEAAIASKKEGYFKRKYEKEGYIILNKIKTGGLGGSIIKWTKEVCAKEAKKYKTKSYFQKNCGSAYNSAHKNNWLDEICSHMTKPNFKPDGYWNNDKNIKNIYKAAMECYSITNFSRKYVTANRVLNLPKNIKHKHKIYSKMGWKMRK